MPQHDRANSKRSTIKKKQGPRTGLVVGGASFAVLALVGASLFLASQSNASDDPLVAVSPDKRQALVPAVVPAAAPATASSTQPPAPAVPAAPTEDPYAELQDELAAPEPEAPPAPRPVETTHGDPVEVTRVVDGDTVYLADGRKVRLIGINTPERDRPLYGEATAALRELIEGADALTLEVGKERTDKFGRTLGYLYSGDTLLNAEIVRQGLAYCYTWKPNVSKQAELRKLQREARAAKLGLWGLEPPEPADHYVAKRSSHHFHREGCRRIKHLKTRQRVQWSSREEPLDLGYNPCEDCGS